MQLNIIEGGLVKFQGFNYAQTLEQIKLKGKGSFVSFGPAQTKPISDFFVILCTPIISSFFSVTYLF